VGNNEVAYNRGQTTRDRAEGLGKARKVGAENIICKFTNFRSSLNKKHEVGILMNWDDIDIFGITESWTHNGITDDELYVTGFNMFRTDRIVREKTRGGGLLL